MTVEELGRRMTGAEFLEWMVYDAHEPLPDRRQDIHWAAFSALNLNLHSTRRGGGPWKADEVRLFRKTWQREPEKPDQAALGRQIIQDMRAWNKRRRRHER